MVDTLPSGLTATGFSGSGWTTNLTTLTATRSNALAAGASYPALTLTVSVASNAPPTVTNTATVAGGGERNTANDTAGDPTAVIANPLAVVTSTTPSFAAGPLTAGVTTLAINFNKPVIGGGTAANYGLCTLGPDGLLGTADDVQLPLTALSSGASGAELCRLDAGRLPFDGP